MKNGFVTLNLEKIKVEQGKFFAEPAFLHSRALVVSLTCTDEGKLSMQNKYAGDFVLFHY